MEGHYMRGAMQQGGLRAKETTKPTGQEQTPQGDDGETTVSLLL